MTPEGGARDPLPWEPRQVFAVGFLVELALVGLAAAIGVLVSGSPFPFRLALERQGLLWGLGATVPMLLLAYALTSPWARRLSFLAEIHRRVVEILGPSVRAWSTEEIVLLSAAAGVGEEILFRGVLQAPAVLGQHGLWVSSLIFGILHAVTPAYFVLATGLGLYLGWTYRESANLLAPILVHSIYDAVALLRLRRELRSQPD